jgi:hypothetical protein
MSTNAAPAPRKYARVLACALCQHRKIKCDRNEPCSNCVKVIMSLTLCRGTPYHEQIIGRPRSLPSSSHGVRCIMTCSLTASSGRCPLYAEYSSAAAETPAPESRSSRAPCSLRGATLAMCWCWSSTSNAVARATILLNARYKQRASAGKPCFPASEQ